MNIKDLGFDPKNKTHNGQLTRAESIFLGILWLDHVGAENAIGAEHLAVLFANALDPMIVEMHLPYTFYGRSVNRANILEALDCLATTSRGRNVLSGWMRDVRRMHNHLLKYHSRIAILSKAGIGGGYWIAESEAEAQAFYDTFRKRGITGLVKASRGKKAVLADMVKQLAFDFDLIDKSGMAAPGQPGSEVSLPVEVVDRFLEKMLEQPEKFADDLRKLSVKFGSVLLPKARAAQIKKTAAELSALMEGL